jgi:hypothetical protein
MTANSLLDRIYQKPFRPFALETVGGSWIDVDREQDVLIYDRKSPQRPIRIVIFDPNGRLYILEPEQISPVEIK